MPYLTDFMGDLDESDPDFRQKWTARLAQALREVCSLKIEGEAFEGAAMLHKGAMALHYTFEALSVLPETSDAIEPLFELQAAIANARYGTKGPLQLSDPEARRARGNAGNPMSVERRAKASAAAVAVELLTRADPPMKVTQAYRAVAKIFGNAGVRGARGGRLAHQTVEMWHTRSMGKDKPERAGIDQQLKHWLPLSAEEALAAAKDWAKEALFAQNLIRG